MLDLRSIADSCVDNKQNESDELDNIYLNNLRFAEKIIDEVEREFLDSIKLSKKGHVLTSRLYEKDIILPDNLSFHMLFGFLRVIETQLSVKYVPFDFGNPRDCGYGATAAHIEFSFVV